jgi:predicted DsbA family dithiol-disulfide isomerase
MTGAPKPLQIVVHHDVLCVWSYIADLRLDAIRAELAQLVRFRFCPFATRPGDALLSEQELELAAKNVEDGRLEAEGKRLSLELWHGADPPRSSLPALIALEAARLQGGDAHHALLRTMQVAALEEGVNVTRADVTFELAGRLGLQMDRFAAAYNSPETRRLVMEEQHLAASRGVTETPALAIAGRWLVTGLHELSEYRQKILDCLGKAQAGPRIRSLH